jgi:proteic killer suppression protein
MIKPFRSKETARIFECLRSTSLPQDIQQVSYRKRRLLCERRMLNIALTLDKLRIPPANRLEKLGGDRAGQDSIASGLMINGRFALSGSMEMHLT